MFEHGKREEEGQQRQEGEPANNRVLFTCAAIQYFEIEMEIRIWIWLIIYSLVITYIYIKKLYINLRTYSYIDLCGGSNEKPQMEIFEKLRNIDPTALHHAVDRLGL